MQSEPKHNTKYKYILELQTSTNNDNIIRKFTETQTHHTFVHVFLTGQPHECP